MWSSLVALLHVMGQVVGNAAGDPEVKAFLEEKRFPLDRLSDGNALLSKAQDAVVRRDLAQGRQMTLTQMLRDFLAAIRDEVMQVRFALQTALHERPDLAAKVGVPLRKGGRRPKPTVDPPPAGAPAAPEKPRKPKFWTVARIVAYGRTMIQGALADPEILAAIEPYSYSKEVLEGLLGRLEELERLNHDQEAAKGAKMGVTKEVAAAGKGLRTWFLPWKKRLLNATRGKQELRTKLGL